MQDEYLCQQVVYLANGDLHVIETVPPAVLTSVTAVWEHVSHVLLASTKLTAILIVLVAVLEHVTRTLACVIIVIWDYMEMHVV